ncbi:hypothetical protein PybrP1_005288 [[Pythium] brassicae (nom. inval.)]|nr:hypothetical protein PybrP1_005288 [[Pythium] brassicae (nom. inval.)]
MGNATSWLAQTLCPEEQVIWVAAKSGEVEMLRQALARLTPQTRFYLEWRDPLFGYSPLANASAHGHALCVRALLAAGADARARDVHGNTPLHLAAKHGKGDAVRALLEVAPASELLALARNASKQQTALDVARSEYSTSDHAHKFVQCIELLEQKLCVYSGWLYQRSDNLLSMASGLSAFDTWKKRYCIVLRTTEHDVVEIDMFSMKEGERRPPCPSVELVYRASDGVQESEDVSWFNRKEFRFALTAYTKAGINRVSAPQLFDFAASSQAELVAWKTFLTSLRLAGSSNQIAAAFGPRAGELGFAYATSSHDAQLHDQRELERALQLSAQDAQWRAASTPSVVIPAPSAPPLSSMHSVGSPRPTLAPDGVEIVQPLHSISPVHRATAARAPHSPDGHDECVICFDGPQSAVCVPCGHNAICMDCAGELLDTTRLCPVCRVPVREVIKIFRV